MSPDSIRRRLEVLAQLDRLARSLRRLRPVDTTELDRSTGTGTVDRAR